jgi:hypothetical protein
MVSRPQVYQPINGGMRASIPDTIDYERRDPRLTRKYYGGLWLAYTCVARNTRMVSKGFPGGVPAANTGRKLRNPAMPELD